MAKVERSIRLIGRTAQDLNSISGAPGEIFLDSSSQTLRLYDGNTLGGSGLAVNAILADAPPVASTATNGMLWFNTSTGKLYIYYNDGDSLQWIQPMTPSFSSGGGGGGLTTEQVQDVTAGLFNTTHTGITVSYNDAAATLTLAVADQAWSQITSKPTFATVATTGSYTDLTNQPTIPTNTNQLTNGAGYVTSTGIASQTGNSGKYLTTDGSTTSWGTITITAASVGLGNVTNESKATMFANPTFTGTVAGVTATHVGLGNVTNESKATMFANPAFTGTVSAFLSGTHTLTASSNLVFTGSTSGTVTFQAGATPQVQTYTLPVAYPASSGYALVSTTGGVLTWTSVAGSLAALSGVSITSPTAGQVLKYNGSLWINDVDATAGGAGVGTVTTVSVASANGFTGTVATASSTPAITITTSITGILKGNATAISAATSGVDYAPGTSSLATGIVKSTTTTGALTIAVSGTDYQAPIGTITGLVKGNGSNALTAAIAGTDYQTAQSVTGIVKSSGTTRSAATSGTDYAPGTSALATGIVKSTTTTGALSIAVSGTDYQAPLPTQTGQTGKYLTTDGTTLSWGTVSSGGAGTVTSASVVSANGFTGTVANATSTPAITITTSITGVLKGNGTAVSAATAGTDYQAPVSATGILKSSGVSGNVSAATAGTDYQAPVSATGILKSSGVSGNVSAAIAGTDYQAPITFTTTGSSGAATFNGTALNIPQYTSGATAFTGLSDVSSAGLTVDKLYLAAVTRLAVTANGSSNYVFDQYAAANPTVYATSGTTIAFNLNVSGHPFLVRTSGGSNFNTGLVHVSTAGVVSTGASAQGQVSGTLYWKIPAGSSGNYQYICSIHGGMVGVITINPDVVTATSVGLGNVTNESKATMFTSPALTGISTVFSGGAGTAGQLKLGYDGTAYWQIGRLDPAGTGSGNFQFKPDGGTSVLDITSSGNLLVGTSSALSQAARATVVSAGNAVVAQCANGNTAYQSTNTSGTGIYYPAIFGNNGNTFSTCGLISVSGSTTTYATASSNTTGAQLNASGIEFPATPVTSANANTLDDYEEGTYTPTQANFSTTGTLTLTGRYTKIGNIIHFSVLFSSTGTIGFSTSAFISTPFTVKQSTGNITMRLNSNSVSFNANQSGAQCNTDEVAAARFFVGNFTTTPTGNGLIFAGTFEQH